MTGAARAAAAPRQLMAQKEAMAKQETMARRETARDQAARAATARDAAARAAQGATERALALSRQTVQAAAAVQRTEQAADDARDRTDLLEQQRADAARALDADSRALAPLLPVIERLSLYPAETLLAAPFAPADSLTALSVLRGIGRGLERKAEATRADASRLQALGSDLDAQRNRLLLLQRDQAAQQQALQGRADAARSAQASTARQLDQAARGAADAAARASTLDGVLARIDAAESMARQAAERDAQVAARAATQAGTRAEAGRRASASRRDGIEAAPATGGFMGSAAAIGPDPGTGAGSAGAPVAGRLVQRFGDSTDAGAATGLRYAPPSLATVTAPCGGRVDFAGPFRSYGQMLILDCGRGARFVLAGLGGIDVGIGQAVARGAQLGHMPAWSDARGRSGLYVQLRQGDRVVDPLRAMSR